jgi:hypothetical protein
MRERAVAFIGVVVVAIVAVWLTPASVAGQATRPAAQTHAFPLGPRTAIDLQGTYDIATLTPLERCGGHAARHDERRSGTARKTDDGPHRRAALPSWGDRSAPPVGGDGSVSAAKRRRLQQLLDRRGLR